MKLLNCKVQNFGSYKELEFDFSNLGLGLIYGPTGSGKSTIMDIVPWILFGQTAKGGSVEEVRSWQCDGESTTGLLSLWTGSSEITICRSRGTKSSNDLYWTESGSDEHHRGKDLIDTQKLIERRLGVSADTFLSGAYFHEFSETGAFFTAKAKDRRTLFERLTNLSLPIRLSERCRSSVKTAKSINDDLRTRLERTTGKLESIQQVFASALASSKTWGDSHSRLLTQIQTKAEAFEREKAEKVQSFQEQIGLLKSKILPVKEIAMEEARIRNESRCNTCGSLPSNLNELLEKIVQDKYNNNTNIASLKRLQDEFKTVSTSQNIYGERLEAESNKNNPYLAQLEGYDKDIIALTSEKEQLTQDLAEGEYHLASLDQLNDLSMELRARLLDKAVREIQDSTNRYLEDYFDAEIRVTFTATDADKLDIGIQKDGHDCVYTQLSKGQRQLLKLCFSVSVMKATANNNGVHFSTLMYDEALDGLDSSLKIKAFRLFEELSLDHESVLVIDHSPDLQALFSRRYRVNLVGDESVLEIESED